MQFIKKYKTQLLFFTLLLFTILIRVVNLAGHPDGLNQDEASIGYDAWSILNYGIDRNGISYPIHLVAWGSGQNALYAYLSMPFIAIFGLNTFSIRIVMAIFSILSVIGVYFIVKQFFGRKASFIAMALYSFCPWTVMSARWSLESNLYPMLFVLGLWALVGSLKHNSLIYLAAFIFSMTLYSYGPAYLVTTLFCFVAFIYFIVKKLIPLKHLIFAGILFLALSTPIYLFVLINAFDLPQIQLFNLVTIPKEYNRIDSILAGQSIITSLENIFTVFMFQFDPQGRCSMDNPILGCTYILSIPFWIYGIYKSIKERNHLTNLLLILSATSFPLLFIFSWVNTNRIGIVYLPVVLFASIGLYNLLKINKKLFYGCTGVFCCLFIFFCYSYFSPAYMNSAVSVNQFSPGYQNALAKAEELDDNNKKTIYVDAPINMPYVQNLFYYTPSPYEFINNAVWYNKGDEFDAVHSYNNYIYSDYYIRQQQIFHKNTKITPYTKDYTRPGIHILLNNEKTIKDFKETVNEKNIKSIFTEKAFCVVEIV